MTSQQVNEHRPRPAPHTAELLGRDTLTPNHQLRQQPHPHQQATAGHFTGVTHVGDAAVMTTDATSVREITGHATAPAPRRAMAGKTSHTTAANHLPTPVIVNELSFYLRHYDTPNAAFLIDGFTQGFHIPSQTQKHNTNHPPSNLTSAHHRPEIVDAKLKKELELERISGPFDEPPFDNLFISPIGLVPKKVEGEFRLIHHLSHPRGQSINSGIEKEFTKVSYHSVDHAIKILCSIEPGAYMAKTDIKNAFRIIPVHPSSYHLLGFKWKEKFYHDRTLAMGLSSSCQIFETFSSALQHISQEHLRIRHMLHILDDFLFIAPSQIQCHHHLHQFSGLCETLGIPLAPEKTEGPLTTLTFAGIELDSISMEARLPMEKIGRYRDLIRSIKSCKRVTLRQLQSAIGALNHCVYIVPVGRAFLRRLINLTIGITQPHHHIRLNKGARSDLHTWDGFLQEFNGKAMFQDRAWIPADTLHLFTDSAQSHGYGAVFQNHWFWGEWPSVWTGFDITLLELYPIVAAVHVWGQNLANKRIVFHTDNQALTFIINKLTSKDNRIMILVRHLALHCLKHNIWFRAEHIPGVTNVLADHLSRFKFQDFHRLSPNSLPLPDTIPTEVLPQNWSMA